MIRASFSAPLTGAIGLVPVVHSLYNEPFHVATQVASLDTASLGRAGWIVGADPDPAIAARHGRTPLAAGDVGDEIADVVEVVRRLWDSWEDDAVIRDVATGRYLDRDRLHYADFEGKRFSVKGPSILPRSPQGQSVVFAAEGTAAEVDVVLLDADLAEGRDAAETARARYGDDVRLVLQLDVVLDRAGRTGQQRLDELDAHSPWPGSGHARYVGTAAGLGELLVELSRVVDGVRIRPAVLDSDLDEIGRAVLPVLRALGVFRSPVAGATLRETLGLSHPANRFAKVTR
ncbi:monooxygenase [Frondihabitans sucicola]|uniref:Monooxygenase n=1 Tax=Frondihabitans sucicola TaxID=1268041 RepID=A0ABN6Y1T4_9MICO|nr:LLM class flavin-dependent oxidoreductase [Frondihabitans sucicola]BDZ51312.1 monooxygenase [Frondihabitans sucicola]